MPQTRSDFLKYKCEITLDPNTAQRNLALYDNNRMVTRVAEEQSYPLHKDRFVYWNQILCKEGLTGRCYWEVEWSGDVEIAVTYIGIKREGLGMEPVLGYNDKSWSLVCSAGDNTYAVRHSGNLTAIPVCPFPSVLHARVGVYVDIYAGTLSFYRVSSDTLTHLYTFESKFTQPLYPGFWCWPNAVAGSVYLCR